ncbi:Ankyrin repeat protein [compost metagenome]
MGKLNEQLIDAARVGNLEKLRRLVQQGADLHADDECALRLAASNGHLEVVK